MSASPPTALSVLIVNYNTAALIDPMMRALLASAGDRVDLQTIVVDNASRDDSLQALQAWSEHIDIVRSPSNCGFGRANNLALERATGRYLLLLNTDAFVAPDTLGKTIDYMEAHPSCGVLGVRLVGRDGVLQPSCRYFPTVANVFLAQSGLARWFPWSRPVDDMTWDHASTRDCDWVPGCYYLIRREVVQKVGLFDPRYFLYYEEVDHCRAVKAAGWAVTYFHDTTVVHIGGESAKSESALTAHARQISVLQIESELLYFRKHAGLAGFSAHLLLTGLAGLVRGAKALLKGQGMPAVASCWLHVRQVWSVARQTEWGLRPTR